MCKKKSHEVFLLVLEFYSLVGNTHFFVPSTVEMPRKEKCGGKGKDVFFIIFPLSSQSFFKKKSPSLNHEEFSLHEINDKMGQPLDPSKRLCTFNFQVLLN